MDEEQTRKRAVWPMLAMAAGISAWVWPIGIGGRMPVGGDATGFSIGLMACLSRAIRSGRLPLWNDLWGFGFPGVAESQMGVFYPPQLVLYGVFSTEAAYAINLALHAYWGALGASWMARKLGVSPWGSALAGFAFAASGMQVIHLPHHWSYTTASWMPWAWGLAFQVARHEGTWRRAAMLAAVLAIQLLPGHFQFAFITEIGVLAIGLESIFTREPGRWKGIGRVAAAMVAVAPLAAMQLWPTWQLARSAESQRDFAYLSAFATPPVHLISYVAPSLFHESPLWRSVAWDPLHAMPEEHRAYIGIVPLWLAFVAVRRGLRSDRSTRLLAILAILTLLMSFGPYVPGFSWLIRLPGFSFFRAPARWGMATCLAMAVLAGKGFDAWRDAPRPGRSAFLFAMASLAAIALVVGLFELALASTDGAGISWAADAFEKARHLLPWPAKDDPTFRQVMASARSSPTNPLVLTDLMRGGIDPGRGAHLRLDRERSAIYSAELRETAALLGILILAAPLIARKTRAASVFLFALAVADVMLLSRHRAIETAPIRPLIEQSPTLARLAEMPAGSRSFGELQNLPMIASASPILAYRTLDRPAMASLSSLAQGNQDPQGRPREAAALRALGASVRVFGPFESADMPGVDSVSDPSLAGWFYGQAWVQSASGKKKTSFRLWKPVADPTRVWFLADRAAQNLPSGDENPYKILEVFDRALPMHGRHETPERFEAEIIADGPGIALFSILDDVEWQAHLIGAGEEKIVEPRPIFASKKGGAWQTVAIPSAGRWQVVLEYRGRPVWQGLKVSAAAWSLLGIFLIWPRRKPLILTS